MQPSTAACGGEWEVVTQFCQEGSWRESSPEGKGPWVCSTGEQREEGPERDSESGSDVAADDVKEAFRSLWSQIKVGHDTLLGDRDVGTAVHSSRFLYSGN